MQLLHNHIPTIVGDHSFINLSIREFLELQPIPNNRDSHLRVRKMKSTFDDAFLNNKVGTLTQIALGVVENDFSDYETKTDFIKGSWYLLDGNTRKHYLLTYPERINAIKNGFTAKIHYLNSMDDIEYAYYPYDAAISSEKGSDILNGLKNRYHWTPRQHLFATGGYRTALAFATRIPGEKDPSLFEQFDMCFDALKILDSIPSQGKHTISSPRLKELKSQAIIGACTRELRFNPNNLKLHDLITRLSEMELEEIEKAMQLNELDPVQIIAVEYLGLSVQRNKNKDAEPWLLGQAKNTKFASFEPQMDFLLYWINKYIQNPKNTYDFSNGIKPLSWKNYWRESFAIDDMI